MAIGTPVLLGTANSTASANTATLTTGADAPAGSLIFVVAEGFANGATIAGVTDSAGNTYSLLNDLNPNFTHLRGAWALTTLDLPNGGSITVTYGATSTAAKMAIACAVSGIAASPLDVNGTGASGSSAAPSYGPTPTLAQASEIAFGMLYTANTSTITETGGFTSLASVGALGQTHLAWQIVSATTALTYAPSLGTSRAWGANIATFEGAASAPGAYPFNAAQRHFYLDW